MSHERQVVIGLNLYQPPREAAHSRLSHINSDPSGQNWTRIISGQSYEPFRKLGVLPRVSFNFFGTLDHDLGVIDPDTRNAIRAYMPTNGVADSYIHVLLPDLPYEDKRIVVGAGIRRFIQVAGTKPRFFWPSETANDTQTLEVLADFEIEGVICGPGQVELYEGEDPSNIPTRIMLPSGRSIVVLPFDGRLSHKLAFDDDLADPDRSNAYKFVERAILPSLDRLRNGFPLLGYTDGETFGHHMRWGGDFIDTLVNRALEHYGIKTIPINQIDMKDVSVVDGRIKDRTAWSCSHGDLSRWHGACDCGSDGLDTGWRGPFYSALHVLNWQTSELVKTQLGDDYIEIVTSNFENGFKNNGSSSPELSLVSAKVSALTALTSCATFFKDPGVSGGINTLFARQAIEHLKDAGLAKEAANVWTQFLTTMQEVHNPAYYNRNGVEMAHDLLGKIAYDGYLPIAA